MDKVLGIKPVWISEMQKAITPDMMFEDAAASWISSRTLSMPSGKRSKGYIREWTEYSYRNYIKALTLFFAGFQLCEIELDHLVKYQRLRSAGAEPFVRYRRPQDSKFRKVDGVLISPKGKSSCPAAPQKVNQELNLLIQILRKAKLWTLEHEENYEPLFQEVQEIPRALRPEEQRRWLDAARSRGGLVLWYSLLAFDTCMSTNEIRCLRLVDVDLENGIVTVSREGAKNGYRHRLIRIATEEAKSALECLWKRAQELGAKEPEHYLFPFRRGKFHPTRHAQGIAKAWDEVRKAADLPWFRPYDTRHTAITRLTEAGVPLAVIMARAGHISAKMTAHYTHISDDHQIATIREALQSDSTRCRLKGSSPDPRELLNQVLSTFMSYGIKPKQLGEALVEESSKLEKQLGEALVEESSKLEKQLGEALVEERPIE